MPDPFVIVPKFVILEAPEAIAVYSCIRIYADYETGECYPAIDTVAEILSVSRSTVERRIRKLVSIGAVEKTSGAKAGKTNLYRFPAARITSRYVTTDVPPTSAETDEVRQERPTNVEPSTDNHLPTTEVATRRQDLLWEIFVEVHGEPATKGERGKYNATVKKLREAKVEPEEYPALVAAFSEKHDGLQPAPATVAERVGELRHYLSRGPIAVQSREDRNRRRAFDHLAETVSEDGETLSLYEGNEE